MARVLVVGDTHCPGMHAGYPSFLHAVYRRWKCDTVVMIGDVVDFCAASYHEHNPAMPSFQDELKRACVQVAILRDLFPEAVVMTGNHDALPYRKARTAGIPEDLLYSLGEILQTGDWQWKERHSDHVIDGVIYRHGDTGKGGQYAAYKNAKENFNSLVQGHWHTQFGVDWYACKTKLVFGMQAGCGIDHKLLAFEYGRKITAKPILGCGVVIDGEHPICEPMVGI